MSCINSIWILGEVRGFFLLAPDIQCLFQYHFSNFWHQLAALKFNSMLPLTTRVIIRLRRRKGSFQKTVFSSDTSHKYQVTDRLDIIGGSQYLLLRFDGLLERLTKLRKALHLQLWVYYRGYKWTARWRGELGSEGSRVQEPLFLLGCFMFLTPWCVH